MNFVMKNKNIDLFLNKKYFFLSFLMVSISIGCYSSKIAVNTATEEKKSIVISGKVEQLFDYCGGARPTKRILDELSIPKPFAEKTFYVKEGTSNSIEGKVITSFTSKADGSFSFQLPKGTYSILVSEQLHSIKASDFENKDIRVDEQCLQKWWKTPYYILEVKDQNTSDLYFLIKHQCYINYDIPCMTFTGIRPR